MRILGIETSCDETGAAVIETTDQHSLVKLLSNVIATSLVLHAQTGGIIPEVAAREQLKFILPTIQQALKDGLNWTYAKTDQIPPIDALAVTVGPGLIGSLLVGIETAKTLAMVWNKPIIPVNHLYGHIYANWITQRTDGRDTDSSEICTPLSVVSFPIFPALALVVSGGHTDLVLMKKHGNLVWLGGTRDDAAGEAFDKIGRLLGLPYPAGVTISKLAQQGNPVAFHFPKPMLHSADFDFSFSGLKTAILREVQIIKKLDDITIANICACTQQTIIDVLLAKTFKAAEKYKVKAILLGGGVAANEQLRNQFAVRCSESGVRFFAPAKNLCTDNAAMIGAAAWYNNHQTPIENVQANPELYFD